MAIVEVPTRIDILAYNYKITLEDTIYILRFYYNNRTSRWMFDILDENENMLLGSRPILTNVDVFGYYAQADLPAGLFVTIDTEELDQNPELNDLGTRVKFLYVESEA